MSAPSFTKGPWSLTPHARLGATQMYWVNQNTSVGTEVEADANLIAAAPALYAVADEFLSSLEMLERHGPDLTADGEEFVNAVTLTDRAEMMRAALKQARGEQ